MRKEKISILIVTPSFKGGGAEKVAINLANQYASEGIDVTLLAINQEGPYRKQVLGSVKIIDLNCVSLIFSLYAVFNALRKIRPRNVLSVIRWTNICVGFSRCFLSIDRVVLREASTLEPIYKSSWYKRWAWYSIMRLTYSMSDWVIANSEGTKHDLIKSKIVNSKKVLIIDNPVIPSNIDELLNHTPNEPWLIDSNLKIILNVARLHREKNQALLIKAFSKIVKKVDNARLIILGEGGEKERLELLAKSENVDDKVKIIPFQSNPFPFYKHADLFVLTSNFEGFGNVIVEALSSGNPVVSTNCPGGPRKILADGKFGILTENRNCEKLSEAILDILNGRVSFERDELIHRSKEYNISSISKKYWSLFD